MCIDKAKIFISKKWMIRPSRWSRIDDFPTFHHAKEYIKICSYLLSKIKLDDCMKFRALGQHLSTNKFNTLYVLSSLLTIRQSLALNQRSSHCKPSFTLKLSRFISEIVSKVLTQSQNDFLKLGKNSCSFE